MPVLTLVLTVVLLILLSGILDRCVRPWRTSRRMTGLHTSALLFAFGVFLAILGDFRAACVVTLVIFAALVTTSNLKFRMLGEPLVFTDIAVAGSFLRYPRFYLAAIPLWLKIVIPPALAGAAWCGWLLFSTTLMPHVLGGVIMAAGWSGLWISRSFLTRSTLMPEPDLICDVRRYGLVATLIAYAWRWQRSDAPDVVAPLSASAGSQKAAPLVVIIQCESFADPARIAPQRNFPALPGLARLKNTAGVIQGDLHVSGFGAYTMRTEFGVLFGQSEEDLGFRRYDPFLTAADSVSHALPNVLSDFYESRVFIHPHDLRFYGREQLLPAMGFTEVIGPENFDQKDLVGPYVGDETLARLLSDRIRKGRTPELIYSVTMENHGPWDAARMNTADALETWYQHAANSDRMLNTLDIALRDCGREACLVFFGDHRPSIPGLVEPVAQRSTPFIVRHYHADGVLPWSNGHSVVPRDLYQCVCDMVTMPETNSVSRFREVSRPT